MISLSLSIYICLSASGNISPPLPHTVNYFLNSTPQPGCRQLDLFYVIIDQLQGTSNWISPSYNRNCSALFCISLVTDKQFSRFNSKANLNSIILTFQHLVCSDISDPSWNTRVSHACSFTETVQI
jgi:hypothetical protein